MVPMLLKTKQDPSPAKRQQVLGVFLLISSGKQFQCRSQYRSKKGAFFVFLQDDAETSAFSKWSGMIF